MSNIALVSLLGYHYGTRNKKWYKLTNSRPFTKLIYVPMIIMIPTLMVSQ